MDIDKLLASIDGMREFQDQPAPPSITPEQAAEYINLRMCLDKILPALAEVGRILAADETVKPRRKKRLLGQLNHAAGHLLRQLESLLPDE